MARPFLCWTDSGEAMGLWLKSILQACGIAEIALPDTKLATWHQAPETFCKLFRANFFFGVLAQVKSTDSPYPSGAPAKELMSLLQWARKADLPSGLLADKIIQIPDDVKSAGVRLWQVDFSDPVAVLDVAPSIVRFAVEQRWGHQVGETVTFTYEPGEPMQTILGDTAR
jgi:hypothetical protein